MTEGPVFYDASGRRRRRFRIGVIAFALLVLLALVILVASVGAVPSAPLLPIRSENAALHKLNAPHGGVLTRTRRSIDWYAQRIFGSAWMIGLVVAVPGTAMQIGLVDMRPSRPRKGDTRGVPELPLTKWTDSRPSAAASSP